MRDPKRLDDFYDRLKKVHKEHRSDLSFYELMNGFLKRYERMNILEIQDDRFLLLLNIYLDDYIKIFPEESRTGCVFCMFGITYDQDKFLRLKEREPKKYDYVMRGGKFDEQGYWIPHNGLGYKFIIDWLNEHGNCNIKY